VAGSIKGSLVPPGKEAGKLKELVVISGKGGTGKTSLVGSFAVLSKNKVLADCDVDAANLHLLVNPKIRKSEEFHGLSKAIINPEECNRCGQCEAACRFGAIKEFRIDPTFCEGCRVCFKLCPVGAISMEKNLSGHWFIGDTLYGPLVFARLGIAEENSGKLVAEVRRAAKAIAEDDGKGYIITDGPPGVGCPVIASLTGADLINIVLRAADTFLNLVIEDAWSSSHMTLSPASSTAAIRA